MSDCIYCPLPKGTTIIFEHPWCGQCGTKSPNFLGTYFDDVEGGGVRFHLVQLCEVKVCPACGHAADVISRPCGGNKLVAKEAQPQPEMATE